MRAYVHEAELALGDGTDRRAPGGAVTVALCGHWDHEGPCRWPHNNALDTADGETVTIRTVFVAPPGEEEEIRGLIDRALRGADGWEVLRSGPSPVGETERPLARKLAAAVEP